MNERDDVVQAFDELKSQTSDVPVWTERLERVALDRARRAGRPPFASLPRLAASVLAFVCLAGATAAAAGGYLLVRALIVEVRVDGRPENLVVDGDRGRIDFETADGGHGSVRVRRNGATTRVDLEKSREAPGQREHDHEVAVRGPNVEKPVRLPVESLGEPVARWRAPTGERRALFAVPDPSKKGTSLFLQRKADAPLARRVGASRAVLNRERLVSRVTEAADGTIEAEFAAPGLQFTLTLTGGRRDAPKGLELETPDGRVRVRARDR